MAHEHEHKEVLREQYMTELRAHFDQLFPAYPAAEIDEVIKSDAFVYRRCDCGDWEVSLSND